MNSCSSCSTSSRFHATHPAANLLAPPAFDSALACVLFVDDEPDILESMEQLTNATLPGLEVLTAGSGWDAVKFLEEHVIDLVVTDYRMPGMDGEQLALLVHEKWPKMPTIMLTAHLDPILWKEIEERVPGLTVMGKPVDIERFFRVARSLIPSLG